MLGVGLNDIQPLRDFVQSRRIADWLEWGRKMREEQRKNSPPAVERLRKLKAEMKAKQEANDTEIFN